MYKSVLLACITTYYVQLSLAHPDVSLGYRYQPDYSSASGNSLQSPHDTSNNYFNSAPAFPLHGGDHSDLHDSFQHYSDNGGVKSNLGGFGSTSSGFGGTLPVSFGDAGNFGDSSKGNSYQTGYVHYSQQPSNFVGRTPIVTKHFWLHSAPEDHNEQQIVRYINIGKPRKNYNVVFIKAPSSNVNKAKIIANVAPVEDKTAIYVLAKKSNELEISAEVATPKPVVGKPEVFFIKYKTPEEATHAQHSIQAQYDALGGSSDVSNEGTIPVSSAIGSLGSTDNDSDAFIGDGEHSDYLPPNHK